MNTDSETTIRQKHAEMERLWTMMHYIRTHGVGCINLEDLRRARIALEKIDDGVNTG